MGPVANQAEITKGAPAHFVLDAGASRFTVQAFAAGLLSVMGHNPVIGIRKFCGAVNFSSDALEASGFKLVIEAASLRVQDDISDEDRREIERVMDEELLETGQYPEIVYEASAVGVAKLAEALYSATMNGNLNFHGVSRREPVTARVALFDASLRASGDFKLRQSDYQMKAVSVAGGALKLRDELKFSFEIVARRQE